MVCFFFRISELLRIMAFPPGPGLGSPTNIRGSQPPPSDIKWGKDLCTYCFEIARRRIEGIQVLPDWPTDYNQDWDCPLFVTWNKRDRETRFEDLRGCIGSLDPLRFDPGLSRYAIKAAFEDGRFDPITGPELQDMVCRVSILHSFEQGVNCYDWDRGTHGIIINFEGPDGQSYSATYLPEIPLEHNMTKQNAITNLIKKSGFKGIINDQFCLNNVKLRRYKSGQVSMDSDEFFENYKKTMKK